ncbi:ABC transporter ATP-binding protein/permease [Algoriphagus sp. AGSA1]|uniref:ABC transporter ATP-binding protein n=1 Tax=Algoriphagus sp. AGSA1 TaxID=2907213 RepID=UPI001F415355|nr:ABC transporter ATP-binding protein [Algoriphagus sp. AGSA1]MCE7054122.1 ABC transporter ATP-binding protein/permease [Algoriphagus sp. AGSA1]
MKKHINSFRFFYDYLKSKIFINMGLNVSVGLLDGFGLVMFLPLLQLVDDSTKVENPVDIGSLGFLVKGIENVGLALNLKTVLVIMLVFFILKGFARFFEAYYRNMVQQFFIKKLRLKSIGLLSEFQYKAFVKSDSGMIQNTLSGEVGRVAAASNSYFMALQSAIMVLVYSVLAFMANPQFAVMVIFGGLLSNGIFNLINKKTIEASRKITKDGHDFQGLLIQKVALFKYLKATGLIGVYRKKLEEIVIKIHDTNIKIGYYSAILFASKEPLVMVVVVVVILVQALLLSQSLGVIILSLLFFYRGLTFLLSLQSFYNGFLVNSGALENITDFFIELDSEKDVIQKEEKIRSFNNEIKFENVSFSYNDTPIINQVNLTIKKNESIAFVGESGSGKTTLVNLISGLILVDNGEILVDGVSLSQIDVQSYQRRIGYITQEPVVFSDTVFNNVTFWSEPNFENIKRFWEVMEKAHIADFIMQLPEKENSFLGTNGILVSGGQKQRISIARELYKDIDILIMDEATSSLDSESEKIIQDNIDSLKGEVTLIIVAHRLATIKSVDRVVLLSNQSILAIDDFESLAKRIPEFKRMVELQTF